MMLVTVQLKSIGGSVRSAVNLMRQVQVIELTEKPHALIVPQRTEE